MGDVAAGGVGVKDREASVKPKSFKPISCKSCSTQFIPTGGNHKSCTSCKTACPSPVVGEKRPNEHISPLASDSSRPRRSSVSNPESYDLDLLEDLSREEVILEFKKLILVTMKRKVENDEDCHSLQLELQRIKKDSQTVIQKFETEATALKVICANKDLVIHHLKQKLQETAPLTAQAAGNPPAAVPQQSQKSVLRSNTFIRPNLNNNSSSTSSKPFSFAEIAQNAVKWTGPRKNSFSAPSTANKPHKLQNRFVIIGKLVKQCAANTINRRFLESLVDFQSSGLVISSFRLLDDKVSIEFLNANDRDDALIKIRNSLNFNSTFEEVHIPVTSFPVLFDLYNVQDLSRFPRADDNLTEKKRKETGLIDSFAVENHILKDNIVFLSVLKTDIDNKAVLLRVMLKSAKVRTDILASAKLLFDGISHRVAPVRAGKEVRQCLGCQKHNHVQNNCRSKRIVCGNCAESHVTGECSSSVVCCANCKGPHKSNFHGCPSRIRAIEDYRARFNVE